MKLADNLDRYKIFDKLQTGPHCLFTFELLAFDCWHIGSQMRDRCLLGYLFLSAVSLIKHILKCPLSKNTPPPPPHTHTHFYGSRKLQMLPKLAFGHQKCFYLLKNYFVSRTSFLGLVNCNSQGAFIRINMVYLETS